MWGVILLIIIVVLVNVFRPRIENWVFKNITKSVNSAFRKKEVFLDCNCRGEYKQSYLLEVLRPALNLSSTMNIDNTKEMATPMKKIQKPVFNYRKLVPLDMIPLYHGLSWKEITNIIFIEEADCAIRKELEKYFKENNIPKVTQNMITKDLVIHYSIGQKIVEYAT